LLPRFYSVFAKITQYRFDSLSGTYETNLEGKFYEARIVASAFKEKNFHTLVRLKWDVGLGS
jgi:hypothetical protein